MDDNRCNSHMTSISGWFSLGHWLKEVNYAIFLNWIISVHNSICRNKKTDCICLTIFDLRNFGGMILCGRKICPDGGTREIVKLTQNCLPACLGRTSLSVCHITLEWPACSVSCDTILLQEKAHSTITIRLFSLHGCIHWAFCHCICLWLPKGTFTSSPTA